MFSVSLMVTTKKKSRVETNKKEIETEQITLEKHQFTKVNRNIRKRQTYKIPEYKR